MWKCDLPIDQHRVCTSKDTVKSSVTGDTLTTKVLMENIQEIPIMGPTDSTLIQSRVLQLQLSCLQIPPVYLKPRSTMTSREDSSMPEKTLRKRKATKHPYGLCVSSMCLGNILYMPVHGMSGSHCEMLPLPSISSIIAAFRVWL